MSILLCMRGAIESAITRYPIRSDTLSYPQYGPLSSDEGPSTAIIVPYGSLVARSRERAAITSEFEAAPLAVSHGVGLVCSGTALYEVRVTENKFIGTSEFFT